MQSDSPSTKEKVRDQAMGVGQSVKQAGGEVVGTTTEQARGVAEEAGRQARDLLNEARDQVRDQARASQQKAAGGLSGIAKQLDGMAEIADKFGDASITSELVRQVSGQMQNVASWLEQREPDDLLHEVRNWARRRPGMFLLGAAVAGMAAGRLTRSGIAAQTTSSADSAPVPPPVAVSRPPQPVSEEMPPPVRPTAEVPSPAGPLPPSAAESMHPAPRMVPRASVLGEEPDEAAVGYPDGRVTP
ncbi:MAG TPA: hypothetical protein VGP04_21185 [Pseudonocardiaceae bacterium]|jgi:uncharacterized protein YjbJ (UPF0337 family)|nr:hypothetical protein [Pseudonocardiaceae bacterium]